MRTFSLILMLALLLPGLLSASAQEAQQLPLKDPALIADRFYTNPLNVADIGDPFILHANGKYYAFATGGTVGYNVWESEDLRTFGNRQKAFRKADWASGDYWAPEVFEHGGSYFMFYSACRKADGSLRVGVAVADQPEGPYEDPLGEPLFDFGYAAIDASLLIDADGTPYLYYSRDCSENLVGINHESHIYVVRLEAGLLAVAGEPILLTVPDQPWEMHSGNWLWNEGPSMVMHEGLYYLYYSSNYFASKEYGVGYAVSPSPTGPFEKPENNRLLSWYENEKGIQISGPGHNSFFMAGGELFTAYHTHRYPQAPSGNRQLNYDRAGFHQDGSAYINGPSLGRRLLPLRQLGLVNAAGAAKASAGSGDAALLVDGDESVASLDYAWRPEQGKAWAELAWDKPVLSDSVLVYPAAGQSGSVRLVLNGQFAATLESTTERLPGEPLVFHFESLELSALRVEVEGGTAMGEIVVLAQP